MSAASGKPHNCRQGAVKGTDGGCRQPLPCHTTAAVRAACVGTLGGIPLQAQCTDNLSDRNANLDHNWNAHAQHDRCAMLMTVIAKPPQCA